MQRSPEDIIIGLLKESPKTNKELLHECQALGLEGNAYYRPLRRLIKHGRIKDAKYILVQEEEANRDEIADVIRRFNDSDNEALLSIISEELIRLTDRKRSATVPNFLDFLESAILSPKSLQPTVKCNILHALRSVLSYELRRHQPDENIIFRLTSNIPKIEPVIENNSDRHVLGEAVLFLSLTDSQESVEIIFKLIRNLTEQEYQEVESGFELSLFGIDSRLYDKQHVSINDKVYELIADGNPTLRERGIKLHRRKMHDRR